MTLQECYRQLNGDYASARTRLMNDRLIDKFVRKFVDDPTMRQLRDAVAANDRKASFSAAHTLKGVAANLSFTSLQHAASALTEQLRDGSQDPDADLMHDVSVAYIRVTDAIGHYMAG